MTDEHPNDPRRTARSNGSQPSSRRTGSRFVPREQPAEPFVTHRAEIGGRYTITMNVPHPGKANDVHVFAEWSPKVPNDLSREEMLQVYQAAQELSGKVTIKLQRETCTHLHVPSSLMRLQISSPESNPATTPKGQEP